MAAIRRHGQVFRGPGWGHAHSRGRFTACSFNTYIDTDSLKNVIIWLHSGDLWPI